MLRTYKVREKNSNDELYCKAAFTLQTKVMLLSRHDITRLCAAYYSVNNAVILNTFFPSPFYVMKLEENVQVYGNEKWRIVHVQYAGVYKCP